MLSNRFKAILKELGIDLRVGKIVDIGTKELSMTLSFARMIRMDNYGREKGWM